MNAKRLLAGCAFLFVCGMGWQGAGTAAAQVLRTNTVYWTRWLDGEEIHYKAREYTFYSDDENPQIRHGLYQGWHPTGALSVQTHYRHGQRHGEYRTWHENGELRESGNYRDGQWHGEYREWYDDGELRESGSYRYGLKDGAWYQHNRFHVPTYIHEIYVEGNRLQYRTYNALELNTVHADYDLSRPYPDLQTPAYIKSIKYHPDQNPKLIATSRSRAKPDGSGVYYYSREDREYHIEGGLKREETWRNYLEPSPRMGATNWVREGMSRRYYVNGQLSSETEYLEGVIVGTSRSWYSCGQIHSIGTYTWGLLDGTSLGYYENGNLRSSSSWRQGRLHGELRRYFANGLLSERGSYSNGEKCGTWYIYWYDEEGTKIREEDHGACEPFESPDPPPPPPEDPGEPDDPDKTIAGRVRDRVRGMPLANVVVSAGGDTTETNPRGYYSISVGNVDSVALTFSKDGYRPRQGNVSLSGTQRRVLNVPMTPDADDSDVTEVTSRYGRIFLQGLPLQNQYTASVDWGDSEPGNVVFELNGTESVVPAAPSGYTMSCNMGTDFNAALNPFGNQLNVWSINAAGERSREPYRLNPIVLPIPPWSLSLGMFKVEREDDVYTYSLEAAYPSEPMAIEISEQSLGSVLWSTWGFVPVIGGQSFGIPPSQLKLGVALSTEGVGTVGGETIMGFKVAGAEIETKIGAKGTLSYDSVGGEGIAFHGAELGGGVKGTVKREFGPVTLIPALAGAVEFPLVGRAIRWFNSRATIDASVSVEGDLKFILINSDDGIVFDRSEGSISSGIELGLGGDIGIVKARISGGGGNKLTYQLPPDPDYIKELEANVKAKLKLVAWSYENEFETSGALKHPDSGTVSIRTVDGAASSGLRLIGTDFVNREPYHVFRGRSANGRYTASAADEPFIANIFPYAEPAYVARGGDAAVIYVAYDPEQPVTQGNELWISMRNADGWKAPNRITHDTHNDYSPAAAYADDGRLVVIWARVRPDDFSGETPESMAPHLEIAYAVYDPDTETWTAPVFLTDSGALDFAPALVSSPGGSLKAFWLHSADNQLIGDTEQPLRLYHAAWNGTDFDSPVMHPYAFSNAFDFSFAYDGQNARVAWIQDQDGDLTTIDDQHPRYSVFDGNAWSAPLALPSDPDAPAARPTLLCTGMDQWELFWQSGDELVRLTDWDILAFEPFRADSGGFAFANYHLSRSDDGRILLLWRALEDETPDIYYRIYDPGHQRWSEDMRLTRHAGRETEISGFLDNDGNIRLFFTRERADEPITDLYYIEQALQYRLTADASRWSSDPETPVLGNPVSLTAYFHNSGELTLTDVSASFYQGNPLNGGQLIETVTVEPAILTAGGRGSATLTDWTAPADIGLESIYVVFDAAEDLQNDPGARVAVLNPFGIDLAVTQVSVGEPGYDREIDIVATLVNHGNAVARNVDVRLRIDDRTMDTRVIPAILPGMEAQIVFSVADTVFFTTHTTVSVEADPEELLPDRDRDNNRLDVVVNRAVGISTMDDGIDDDWKRRHFGHLNVDPDEDADGDGFTILQEFLAGTDPLDARSFLRVEPRVLDAIGTTEIRWPARMGRRYRVERSYDLETWSPFRDDVTAHADGVLFVIDGNASATNQAFYRVVLTGNE